MTEHQEELVDYKKNDTSEVVSTCESTEEVEQIGKDIIVARRQSFYEDDRNVISVIINALSVRINMPSGTVKALMVCLIALIIVAFMCAGKIVSNRTEDAIGSEDTRNVEEKTEPSIDDTKDDSTGDGVLALKDYVNISAHYYYHLPKNIKEVWEPDELYAENETFCDFIYDDNLYTIRSYVLEYTDNDLTDIVKGDLALFDNMNFIDEEYIDGKYGEILKIKFESVDEEGGSVVGTGYYWYESVPKICCLEVSSDTWHDGKAEEMIKDSIYRVSTGNTAPYSVNEEAWSDIQKDEAMKSLAEEAVRDCYEQKPDYTDRVLKP